MNALQSSAPTAGRRAQRRTRTTDLDDGDRSPRTASLVAGIGLLAMAILTPYALFVVLDSLTVATFTGPGEVALASWLLFKGIRSPSPTDRPLPADRAPAAV